MLISKLLDPSQQIIDEITFGAQTTDISFGRYPNGTGEFVFMEHSFDFSNNEPLTSISFNNNIFDKFYLSQNFPNPFNPITTIKYSIPDVETFRPSGEGQITRSLQKSYVQLKIYDILGREVRTLINQIQSPGNYIIKFDASDLHSGVYIYKLQFNDYTQFKKMIYLK